MEELLVFALLLYENIIPEDEYLRRVDELFLDNPENEDLLYLEWETNIEKAIVYIRTHIDYSILDYNLFGKFLMEELKVYYEKCSDIQSFSDKMYSLWESLPGNIQEKQPFFALCYADAPLSWGDEKQTREIYEDMMNYYKN